MGNFKDYLISGLCKSSDTHKDPKKLGTVFAYLRQDVTFRDVHDRKRCLESLDVPLVSFVPL
jgi:hypothetical protein